MTFQQTLSMYFPKAMPEMEFVTQLTRSLAPFGFNRSSSIVCLGLCRDEITQSFARRINEACGEVFNYSSLAGMLFLGKTGFLASQHHAPRIDGREHIIYITLPHIAIGLEGEIGLVQRANRDEPSTACGALAAFQKELASGKVNLEFDPDDVEQSLLKQKIFPRIPEGKILDLLELTKVAYEIIVDDLERMILLTIDKDHSYYAVLTGIQIHGPTGGYIWPGVRYVSVEGNRINLSF